MTDKSIWNKPIPVPASVISYVDDAVKALLPAENKIVGISPSGSSYWARTAKIETETPDGEEDSYFIKVQQGDYGSKIFVGEFASMKALHNAMPDLVPKPVGTGSYVSDPDKWFYLSEFKEMVDEAPDVEQFASMIAEMHKRGKSPDGKFGFPVETYGGRIPMIYPVSDTWEQLFTGIMKVVFDVEEQVQGADEDMQALRRGIMEKVIPRLLRPMETGGRTLTARLVHSDLWHGNVGIDVKTDLPVIFDGIATYAHNEYELAPWRCVRHNIGRPYIIEYLKHFPVTEPAEDFEDRVLLYCIKFNLNSSAHYPGNVRFRNIVREEMRELVDKYPEGLEGYTVEHGLAKLDLKEKPDTAASAKVESKEAGADEASKAAVSDAERKRPEAALLPDKTTEPVATESAA